MPKTIACLVFAIAVFCQVTCSGWQKSEAESFQAMQSSMLQINAGKYLAGQLALEAIADEKQDAVLQQLAAIRSFTGDYHGALVAMDLAQRKRRGNPGEAALTDLAKPHEAIDFIVDQARDRQIVILNEAHHDPRHRAFALQLAIKLREIGYDYFAAEALGPFTRALKRKGYAEHRTGFYVQEPVFGRLARRVVQLGFEPIDYEAKHVPMTTDLAKQINAREEAQCQNLINKIFNQQADAKVFIYVGYSHASEHVEHTGSEIETAWLAARLARETGHDPLTIDQTIQTEHGDPKSNSADWSFALKKGWLDRPSILVTNDHPVVSGNYAGAMDLQVFHPPAQIMASGRPDWLEQLPNSIVFPIPATIKPEGGPILVQAFCAGDNEFAIPFDQVVLRPEENRKALILQAGEFRLVVQDASGAETNRETVMVEQ